MSNAIKANEVRVGNLFINFIGEVFPINGTTIAEWNNPSEFKQPEPIQLTEEWLMKLGFKKDYESIYRKVFGLTTPGRYWSFNMSKTPNEKDHFEVKGFWVDIELVKYIHQLQNLYFALTGTELTLTD